MGVKFTDMTGQLSPNSSIGLFSMCSYLENSLYENNNFSPNARSSVLDIFEINVSFHILNYLAILAKYNKIYNY